MKVRERIDIIADIFMAAVCADGAATEPERRALAQLLCDLLLVQALPAHLQQRLDAFDAEGFDLAGAARDFAADPPMKKRRLLELAARICHSDGVFDLAEDDFLRELGAALGMEPSEYDDLVLDYEIRKRLTPPGGLERTNVRILPPTPPYGTSRW